MTVPFGYPVRIFPDGGKPGCLEALRARLAALTGCLTAWLVRGLWMLLGAVIGALVGRGCK